MDQFESGFMLREPSWHKKENAVLQNSPATWEEARKEAGLTWDVYTADVTRHRSVDTAGGTYTQTAPSANYQAICRDDKEFTDPTAELAIQKSTYKVITNEELGEVVDTVLGLNEDFMANDEGELLFDEDVEFEVLMSLYGGRQIVALLKFTNPINMDWDPSTTYKRMCMASRHDGQGGLRQFFTNVRTVCANTFSYAEATDGKRNGFVIKHTANWSERLAELAQNVALARGETARWISFAEEMAAWQVKDDDREKFLKKLLPASDDQSERKLDNILTARQSIRGILESPSCEHIKDNGYGLVMAATEFNDHFRDYQSTDSYITRQLLHKEPFKARASKIVLSMAKA